MKRKELKKLVYNSQEITTSLEDGLRKVVEGLTTMEEVLKTIDTANIDDLNI